MSITDDFQTVSDRLRAVAQIRPEAVAIGDSQVQLTFREFDDLVDRVACALQRDGVKQGDSVATCAAAHVQHAATCLGILRAGAVPVPIASSVTTAQWWAMVADCGAQIVLVDDLALPILQGLQELPDKPLPDLLIDLGGSGMGTSIETWLAPPGSRPTPVHIGPDDPFNIIYSSGTTGTPKGIVQPHGMRFAHMQRASRYGISPQSVMLLATPLYSNTTLVAFYPALGAGARIHLMEKFDASSYLSWAQRLRATHTMLVPVQYRRLMAHPDFEAHDLCAFEMKLCTSAPFDAALKADILRRWPGELLEIYGMTEGGGACMLNAREHPTKLHTVGPPASGHDLRLIDANGRELPRNHDSVGEVVGRSPGMMKGYHGQPALTREAEWFDAQGLRYIRTGDIGRFDEDGFLVLMDRSKDMVISGGFNIFPKDLEAVLRQHPEVDDVSVFGVPSARWGETPVAYVVLRRDSQCDLEAIRLWANERVGRTQRLAAVHAIEELPRSTIGKVLKRELRQRWLASSIRVD